MNIHGRFIDDMCTNLVLLLILNIYIKSSASYSLPTFSKLTDERSNRSIRAAQQNGRSCVIPHPTEDKTVTYTCGGNVPEKCDTASGYVPEFTLATIKCATNHYSENIGETNSESICRNKKWLPEIGKCSKICKKLNPVNIDFQCRRNGMDIPCDENTVMLAGTRVRPECKQWYKYAQPPNYLELTCGEDGTWDNPLLTCIPECGQKFSNPKPLIGGGTEEHFGDSPWHVAIYNKEKKLICGGTIISLSLVISAAHCFTQNANYSKDIAKDYEIVVSKFTRNYNVEDNKNQKVFKIKDIRFSKKGFFGLDDKYASDVAVIILQGSLSISSTVLPACLDWIGLKKGRYPAENELGKVVGWGMNEHGKYTETLRTTDLPFIGRERCIQSVPDEFKPYITFDKFCAGSESGPSVLQGDSGGGLLFKQSNVYYLRGVVSIKQPTKSSLAAFTDLSEHIQWISDIRYEIENDLKKMSDLIQQVRFEMLTKARNDPTKLLQLSQYLKKEVINRQTAIDDLKLEAQSLLEVLKNTTLEAASKLISEALLTNGLSKTHQLSSDILKSKDYTTYFDIFDSVVESITDKMTVKELLPLISRDNEACCIEELLSIYVAIFDKLQRSGEINKDPGIKFADRFRQAIEASKNKNIDHRVKSKVDQIKDKLPQSGKNDVDSSRSKVCIKNIVHSQHLVIFEPTSASEKRSNKPSEWLFESEGEYVYIKHNQSQKYMLANFQEKYNNSDRTALTFKLGGKIHDGKWKIIDCPSRLSRTLA